MNKTLAQGHKWTLTQEGNRVYLSLVSEYGTVEFLAKDVSVLRMLESIARGYDKLKEQGPLEQAILEAAQNNDDRLDGLLQEAIEKMDEAQADRLLDKVHQVQKERLRDLRGWKEDDSPDNPLDADWVQPDDA